MRLALVSRAVVLAAALAVQVRASPRAPASDHSGKQPEIDLHAGAYVWHYQPLTGAARPKTEIYAAYIDIDAKLGPVSLHVEPRFRDTKLRAYYPGNVWLQEAYAAYESAAGALKVGKIYTRFGLFWDDSFYGNIQYFDGLKLDPELGVSLTNSVPLGRHFTLDYSSQYFPIDGLTNGSLPGRDTISVPGARRRDMGVLRFAPRYSFSRTVSLDLGLSAERFTADFAAPAHANAVVRYALDTTARLGALTLYAEVARQQGRSVLDFPVRGHPSAHNDYALGGARLRWRWLTLRYTLSLVDYRDAGLREVVHLPGITAKVGEHLDLMVEYALWLRYEADNTLRRVDNSVNLVVYAHF